jgi:hypothetical protein
MPYSHVSFSDESNWNTGQYRSIGMLSGPRSDALLLHREITRILSESDVRELKWNKIRTAKYRLAAQKAIDAWAGGVSDRQLRIDVLIWDSHDNRHSVRNPDLEANLQIMYFHLFRNVMSRRWPSDCVWRHIPDEHVGLNWDILRSCLSAKESHQVDELPFTSRPGGDETFAGSIKRLFRVAEITECRSQEMCLTQLSDLFAGMGAFSRERFNDYRSWKRSQGYASTLFEAARQVDRTSGVEEKYQVLSHFEAKAAALDLAVALDQTGGLRTLDPSIPVNFWWYQPHSRFDKARAKQSNDLL